MKCRHTTALLALSAAAAAGATRSATPAHLALADRMVRDVRPADNSYANGPFTVTWAGVDGSAKTFNKSDCTTFVTALLRTAYRFTPSQFDDWFGKSSPSVGRYYDAAVASRGLHGFTQVADLRAGDLLISKFATGGGGGAAGHMMVADGLPQRVASTNPGVAYDLVVIDCTASPHAHDTRAKPQSGVGRGTVRLYADAAGKLTTWAWSSGNAPSRTTRPCGR